MKKLYSLLLVVVTTFVLVACGGSKNSLDGEYYWIDDSRKYKILTIDGDKGILKSEGTRKVKVDEELGIFEVSGFINPTVEYKYEDGILIADLTGVEREYYKKGTPAFDKVMKKYGYTEADLED